VFEQSLLLNPGTKRPWNFLASLGAELIIVSLALLIPLLYSEHLPAIHWKEIMVGPPPSAPPVQPPAAHTATSNNTALSPVEHRLFRWNPATLSHSTQPSTDFTPDAPPSLGIGTGPGLLAGNNNMLGRFLPNVVAAPPPKPTPETQKPPQALLEVGGDVQMAKLLRKVIPVYPQLARSARISGVVRLIGIIAKDGTIQNLQVVSGHPLLTQAAVEAVRQWVYKPTLLNGTPVEVIAPIEVNFTLGQ